MQVTLQIPSISQHGDAVSGSLGPKSAIEYNLPT